jgi:hypothetical protein
MQLNTARYGAWWRNSNSCYFAGGDSSTPTIVANTESWNGTVGQKLMI